MGYAKFIAAVLLAAMLSSPGVRCSNNSYARARKINIKQNVQSREKFKPIPKMLNGKYYDEVAVVGGSASDPNCFKESGEGRWCWVKPSEMERTWNFIKKWEEGEYKRLRDKPSVQVPERLLKYHIRIKPSSAPGIHGFANERDGWQLLVKYDRTPHVDGYHDMNYIVFFFPWNFYRREPYLIDYMTKGRYAQSDPNRVDNLDDRPWNPSRGFHAIKKINK